MDREYYTGINSRIIDGWVKDGWEWEIPISPETFQRAKEGDREGQGLLRDYMPQYLVTPAYKPWSSLWD